MKSERPTPKSKPSAPDKRNYNTVKQRRGTSDERPLFHPLTWRGTDPHDKPKQHGRIQAELAALLVLATVVATLLAGVVR